MLSLLFMPDPLRVSLTEVDRRWSYIKAGKEYHGEAVNPWNLSNFERFLGHHKTYNRAKDEEDKYPPPPKLAAFFEMLNPWFEQTRDVLVPREKEYKF
jgi:hypothetical protein